MKPESNDIDRIINSDEAAFCRFMERYSSRLYHYVFALIGQKEPAEEVVSDVFYEVWKNRKTLGGIENMNAWIQTITYRKAISYLRKETGKTELSLDGIGDFIFAPIQSPDEAMISKEEMEKIEGLDLSNGYGVLVSKYKDGLAIANASTTTKGIYYLNPQTDKINPIPMITTIGNPMAIEWFGN